MTPRFIFTEALPITRGDDEACVEIEPVPAQSVPPR